MSDFDLVIFDCDGVLVDSEALSHGVLVEMLAELGVEVTFSDAVRRFIGTPMSRHVALVGELLGRPAPADHLAQFARRTQTAFTAALQPVAGILALLSALKVPCCVASNGNRAKMNFTLGHTGLLPQFQGRMYSADDVVNPKPAPDLFLHAARCHGVAPRRCVVIEDTATGIRAARAAAMTACGYAGLTPAAQLQAAGADAVFSRMGQLQAWLGDRGCAS